MKPKKVYVCSECDYQSSRWLGRCPQCNAWNTFVEETYEQPKEEALPHGLISIADGEGAVALDDMEIPAYMRQDTGMGELDRVLGGGLVDGSVVLLAGEPGIGKSTLLMQICGKIPEKILYVSGEESRGQLKMRANRLDVHGDNIYFMTETDVSKVLAEVDKIKPEVMIVDSVQTMCDASVASIPGSIAQVKECAMKFISKAKACGISVILVGHVNKEGVIAGPKVLEHMVDAVLYFEGERLQSYRIIRAIKNRFGSTNEIGVFEMSDRGLLEVPNPSEMLLSGRPEGISGNCAVCVMEGTRPIVAEIQALIAPTAYPSPRRTVNGVDYNRVCLLLAVLEKRLGLRFSACDVYLNVIGGLKLDEPAADLAVALALISGIKDIALPHDLIAIGEIGLAGECRAVTEAEKRIREATRLGFDTILIPHKCVPDVTLPEHIKLIPMRGIYDSIRIFNEQKSEQESRSSL